MCVTKLYWIGKRIISQKIIGHTFDFDCTADTYGPLGCLEIDFNTCVLRQIHRSLSIVSYCIHCIILS